MINDESFRKILLQINAEEHAKTRASYASMYAKTRIFDQTLEIETASKCGDAIYEEVYGKVMKEQGYRAAGDSIGQYVDITKEGIKMRYGTIPNSQREWNKLFSFEFPYFQL